MKKKTENEYPIGGYVPGHYIRACDVCGHHFIGDKYAYECKPCAVNASEEFYSELRSILRELKILIIK